jgi:ATP-dependent RNA helicase DDX27
LFEKGEISLILEEEKMDKEARDGLRDVTRATNLIEHRDEILSRPKKEWFMTAEQKSALQEKNDAIEAKKREKQLKKKLKKQEEKQKNSTKEGWIPEEQMSKVRRLNSCGSLL